MARPERFPRGSTGSARRRPSARIVSEDSTQLPFPKPQKTARKDCSWRSQQQQQQQEQQEQQEQLGRQSRHSHGNRQPRVLRADNSWVSQHLNQTRELANYGLLQAEAFRDQLSKHSREISSEIWRHHWMKISNLEQEGTGAAEGIELQPLMRHQRLSRADVERIGLQPKKRKNDHAIKQANQTHQASQILVKEQAQQLQKTRPSDESQTLPEGALLQQNAAQHDSGVPAAGLQTKEAQPKLFDMTLNDYDDYETDFFPGSSTMITDDSGHSLSQHKEGTPEH